MLDQPVALVRAAALREVPPLLADGLVELAELLGGKLAHPAQVAAVGEVLLLGVGIARHLEGVGVGPYDRALGVVLVLEPLLHPPEPADERVPARLALAVLGHAGVALVVDRRPDDLGGLGVAHFPRVEGHLLAVGDLRAHDRVHDRAGAVEDDRDPVGVDQVGAVVLVPLMTRDQAEADARLPPPGSPAEVALAVPLLGLAEDGLDGVLRPLVADADGLVVGLARVALGRVCGVDGHQTDASRPGHVIIVEPPVPPPPSYTIAPAGARASASRRAVSSSP